MATQRGVVGHRQDVFATRVQRWKERFTVRQLSAGMKVLKLLLPSGTTDALDSVTDAIDSVAEAVEKTPKAP